MAQVSSRTDGAEVTDAAKDQVDKTKRLAGDTTRQVTEAGKQTVERLADAGRAVFDQAQPQAAYLAQAARTATTQAATRGTQAARHALGIAAPVAHEVLSSERDLAALWLGAVGDQVQANLETARRLTTARDWREAVELQSAYVRENIERTSGLLHRHLDAVARLLQAGQRLERSR